MSRMGSAFYLAFYLGDTRLKRALWLARSLDGRAPGRRALTL